MTPEQRAKKILYGLPLGLSRDEKVEAIAAEIRAAVEDQIEYALKMVKAQRKMALAQAYEDAGVRSAIRKGELPAPRSNSSIF